MKEDEIDEITGITNQSSEHERSRLNRSGKLRSPAHRHLPVEVLDLADSIIPEKSLEQTYNIPHIPLDSSSKGNKAWFTRLFFKIYSPLSRQVRKLVAKIYGKKYVEVLRVIHLCQGNPRLFQDGWIDAPRQTEKLYGSVISITGWVMGKKSQPVAVRVTSGQLTLTEVPFNIPRPDVVKIYFSNHIALGNIINFGYGIELPIEGLLGESNLQLEAVFSTGHVAPIGLICLSRFG